MGAQSSTVPSQRELFTLCDITYSRLTSSASSQLFDKRMLSLSDSRGLRLPWFIPSVLPSTCPHLLHSNEPTHVLVAPCSSSPSPGRCGFIRSSLPSDTGSVRPSHVGGTARHRHLRVGAASQLVTAISGSVRPLLLLLLVAASRRQHLLGLTGIPTHFVFVVNCLFRRTAPTDGSTFVLFVCPDARLHTPASRTACSSTSHFTPCCQCRCVACAFSNLGW